MVNNTDMRNPEIIVTEKIDGTNGQLLITEDGEIKVGSRTQWITPEKDNHGFAKWVQDNQDEILQLGVGRHFGEWWGNGINRGYGLQKGDKRFSLFNTKRWALYGYALQLLSNVDGVLKYQDMLPKCCGLVPELYRGIFDTNKINEILEMLKERGSQAVKGYMKPEGIVIYHIASNIAFKKTIENDKSPKSLNK